MRALVGGASTLDAFNDSENVILTRKFYT
jgi:hypothetical protein